MYLLICAKLKKRKERKKETQEGKARKYNEVHYPQGMGGWEWVKNIAPVVVRGRINNFLRIFSASL